MQVCLCVQSRHSQQYASYVKPGFLTRFSPAVAGAFCCLVNGRGRDDPVAPPLDHPGDAVMGDDPGSGQAPQGTPKRHLLGRRPCCSGGRVRAG